MTSQPTISLLTRLPSDLIEMINEFNRKQYIMNKNKLGGKNNKFNIDLINKHRVKLLEIFEEEKQKTINCELEIRKRYSNEEQIRIGSMYAYFRNKCNGFDDANDEILFEEYKKNQKLYEEVLKWVDSSKDYHYLSNVICRYRVIKSLTRRYKLG